MQAIGLKKLSDEELDCVSGGFFREIGYCLGVLGCMGLGAKLCDKIGAPTRIGYVGGAVTGYLGVKYAYVLLDECSDSLDERQMELKRRRKMRELQLKEEII